MYRCKNCHELDTELAMCDDCSTEGCIYCMPNRLCEGCEDLRLEQEEDEWLDVDGNYGDDEEDE